MRTTLLTLALALIGCANDTTCGQGLDPVIVTGLNGLLDGTTPAVEIDLRIPETCELRQTEWMFWNETQQTATLGAEPTSGMLDRRDIHGSNDIIVFTDAATAVRLDYPGGTIGPKVTFTWLVDDVEKSAVDCDGSSGTLVCTVRALSAGP